MKILNIDAFEQVTRQISFVGKTYPVEEPSVQQFINNLKAAENLEKAGTKETVASSFEAAIATVSEAVPTLDRSVIAGFKIATMTAVLEFIRGDADPKADTTDAAAAKGSDDEGADAKKPT